MNVISIRDFYFQPVDAEAAAAAAAANNFITGDSNFHIKREATAGSYMNELQE